MNTPATCVWGCSPTNVMPGCTHAPPDAETRIALTTPEEVERQANA